MPNKLKIKRGPASTIPTGELAEPLFTSDTYDLYIGTGASNQRFQKYIASGTTSQYLRGDGSLATHDLDSLTDVIITSPSNGQILSYNGTNWVNNALSGYVTGGATAAGQVGVWNSTTNIVGYTTFTFDNATDKLSMTNAYVNNNLTVDGQLVIKSESGASAYTRGLKFPDNSYGGSGDTAGLRLHNAGGENLILELYVGNDSLDTINFAVAAGGSTYNDNVTINGNKIWNAGNLPSPLSSTGSITSGEIAIFSNATTVYSDTSLFWDNSLNRLGIGGNSPNAQVGVSTSSGVNAFGYKTSGVSFYELVMGFDNTTYGHTISTSRGSSTTARDLTLLNNTTILALDENNSVGINTLSPVTGSTGNAAYGLDIYSSSNTNAAGIALHTVSSGSGLGDGARIMMRNDGSLFIVNLETGGTTINGGDGDFQIITLGAQNFLIDSATGRVGINSPASLDEILVVNGSIRQTGVTSSLLKTDSVGKIIAAVANTDFQSPITLTTTGTSGAATFSSNTLNIPQYQAALTNPVTGTGYVGSYAKFTNSSTIGSGIIYDNAVRVAKIGDSAMNSWASPFYVLQGGDYGQFIGFQTNAAALKMGSNAYYTSGNYYYSSTGNGAALIDVYGDSTNGGFTFTSAPAGTAGNVISFTTKFQINNDASVNINAGFLGINHSSSPSTLIDARNSSNAIATFKNTTGGASSYSSVRLTTANSGVVGDSVGEIRGLSTNATNRDIALTFLTSEGSASQTEKMRITASGNVGIGVTPSSSWASGFRALQIQSQPSIAAEADLISVNVNAYYDGAWKYLANGYATNYYQNNGTHVWRYAASNSSGAGASITWSNAMTITSGGNVLINKTSSTGGKLQVSNGTDMFNVDHDANGAYITAVNNANTVYKRMTYDASEHIFATSASAKLTIASTGAATFSSSAAKVMEIQSSTASGGYVRYTYNTTTSIGYIGSSSQLSGSGAVSDLELRADNNLLLTTTSGQLRLTSGGNVGIGTSSPGNIVHAKYSSTGTVNYYDGARYMIQQGSNTANNFAGISFLGSGGSDAAAIWSVISSHTIGSTTGSLVFGTTNASGASTERMRITSGGNLLINNTYTTASKLIVRSEGTSSATYSFVFTDSGGQDILWGRSDGLILTGSRANSPYNYTTGSAANMYVDSSGYLYRSTSSLKYKTDVRDYDKGLSEVLQIKPVYYKGKRDGDTQFAGLIAEQIHEIGLTEFVHYAKDGSPDALAYQNMVALLTKAIQELKAEIDTLKK